MKSPVDRRTRADDDHEEGVSFHNVQLSFEEITSLVGEALRMKVDPTDDFGPWIKEIWNDHVVYEHDGKAWGAPYVVSLEPLQAVVGEAVEVISRFVPVSDGKAVLRVDTIRELHEIHQDPKRKDGILATVDKETGFLKLEGNLTTIGVFDYEDSEGNTWGEYRSEDEVFSQDTLDSFKMVHVTNEHPDEFIDVGNVKAVDAGHVGTDVRRSGAFMRATMLLTDAKTIIAALSGKTQLSCGYTSVVLDESGQMEDGTRFDATQTTIRGNHLAIVDVGRAGPDCALIIRGDGAAFTRTGGIMPAKKKDTKSANGGTAKKKSFKDMASDLLVAMKAKKDADHDEDEEKDALKEDQGAMEQAQAIIDMLTKAIEFGDEAILEATLEKVVSGGPAVPSEEVADPEAVAAAIENGLEEDEDEAAPVTVATGDAVGKLRGEVDVLRSQRKKDQDNFNAHVDQRVGLVAKAQTIIADLEPTGKTDADIMRAVVLEVDPGMKARLDENVRSPGYLKAAYDTALDLHTRRELHTDSAARLAFDTRTVADDNDPDKSYVEFIGRRDDRSKAKATSAA